MTQYLVLEMPIFYPKHKLTLFNYSNKSDKTRIRNELSKTSEGYCMYCYSRVISDGKNFGHLEHAIEKNNSEKLVNCVPNIGLACSKCNESFKKVGENKRKLTRKLIEQFEQQCECEKNRPLCNSEGCAPLNELRESYVYRKNGHIILQPMGIISKYSQEPLRVQYDVLRSEFQPATHYHMYDEKDIVFIADHIRRFKLNDSEYHTRSVRRYARNVIDLNGKLIDVGHENLAAEMFMRALQEKTLRDRIKICEAIYTIGMGIR